MSKAIQVQGGQPIKVRLGKLFISKYNVRQPSNHFDSDGEPTAELGETLEELADNIAAMGLLQGLVVHKDFNAKKRHTGRFGVCAGGRRLRALLINRARGLISDDAEIDCIEIDVDQATLASLSENNQRKDMHPVEEFLAFQKLQGEGRSIEDIAAAFRLTPLVVKRRLRLANVAPELLEGCRRGDVELDQLMALAVVEDQEQQKLVWSSTPEHQRTASRLRHLLTNGMVPTSKSGLLSFVGLEAYQEAGGEILQDLFDDNGGGLIANQPLLATLARDKLETLKDGIKAEGWGWVDVWPDFTQADKCQFGISVLSKREPTAEEQQQIEALETEIEALNDKLEAVYDKDESDEDSEEDAKTIADLEAVIQEKESALDVLNGGLEYWSDEVKGVSGVVLTVVNGQVVHHRGLIRPEDATLARKVNAKAMAGSAAGAGQDQSVGLNAAGTHSPDVQEEKGLSARLRQRLTARKTAALQHVVSQNVHLGLAALANAMVGVLGHGGGYQRRVLQITAQACDREVEQAADELQSVAHWADLNTKRKAWSERLPQDGSRLAYLASLPLEELTELLALCAALTINVTSSQGSASKEERHLEQLAGLDMSQWWEPTRESFFGHVPKALIAQTLVECGMAQDALQVSKLSKAEAVERAQEVLKGRGWVPELLRMQDPSTMAESADIDDDADDEAHVGVEEDAALA